MEDQTGQKQPLAEIRKPLRPKYKDRALTWKRLFIGAACLVALLAYLLGMTLKGNRALQLDKGVAAVTK